jgi:hypothetical protein
MQSLHIDETILNLIMRKIQQEMVKREKEGSWNKLRMKPDTKENGL